MNSLVDKKRRETKDYHEMNLSEQDISGCEEKSSLDRIIPFMS